MLLLADIGRMVSSLWRLRVYRSILAVILLGFACSSWARGMFWASCQLLVRSQATVVMLEDSGSMEPTFDTRDVLIVQACEPHEISSGDVLSFKLPPALAKKYGCESVMHRVVGRTRDNKGWATKGDHNEQIDSWVVTPEWLRGKLVARYRI